MVTGLCQHVLSRGGGECIAHALQTLNSLNLGASVFSVGDIGVLRFDVDVERLHAGSVVHSKRKNTPLLDVASRRGTLVLWEDGWFMMSRKGKAVNRVKNVRRCSLRWCNTALSSLHNRNNGVIACLDVVHITCIQERMVLIYTWLRCGTSPQSFGFDSHLRVR